MSLTARTLLLLGAAGSLALSLSACAPEPGETAGQAGKGTEPTQTQQVPEEATRKHTELPESFPADEFRIPAGAVIDDAGERGEGAWFLVLRADDEGSADELWAAVIAENSLTEAEDPDSGLVRLSGASLTAEALRLPGEGGAVLLSYDIAR